MKTEIIWIYLAVINVFTFFTFAVDKYKAKHHKWRVSEAFLLGCSFLGGAVGGFLSMKLFHHKTRKPRFAYGVPFMIVLHIVVFLILIR